MDERFLERTADSDHEESPVHRYGFPIARIEAAVMSGKLSKFIQAEWRMKFHIFTIISSPKRVYIELTE